MRLQLSAFSVFLSLTSAASASSLGSITEGVAGAIIGTLGAADGKSGSDSPVPLRRSITELAAEAGPQWDLYLQALRSMYDRDSKDPESFFQVAGIHGRPFMQYNNAGVMNTNGWGGYSTHGENLFIIWHRPFVALFEQTLVKEAKNLAASYPDDLRSIYQKAADDLRAPYWDWALEPRLPSVVLPETIEVKVATKTGVVAKSIDNPLYTYRFPKEVMQGQYGAFNTYDRMYRCQNPEQANQNLYSRNYKSWLYDTYAMAKSFSEFATTASKGGSLEGVHNAIHWDSGCGGQFMDSQFSAFEPLFMLHHSNVDRLWAYWQAMHPEASTFNGAYQGLSRFNTFAGTMIGLDSPLQPFRQTNGDWHTSRSVNSITTFGYSYQGLEYWTKSETELQQSAIQMINSLYGPEQKQKPSTSSAPPKSTQTNKQSTSTQSPVTSSSQLTRSTKQSTSTVSTETSSAQSAESNGKQSNSTQSTGSNSAPSAQTTGSQSTPTRNTQSVSTNSAQSSSADINQSTETSSKQSSQTNRTQSSETGNVSTQTSSKQSTSTQLTQSPSEGASTDIPTPSAPTASTGNSTSSSQSTVVASSQSGISSPSQNIASLIASSAATAAVPTTTARLDAHPDFNTTETGDYKRFYAGITVDVSYLPVRPCAIEISIDMWRAGGMAIMQMPERGVIYDSISLSDAIASAKLGGVPDDELLSEITSRLHVTLRKADGSSIDVTQISGLKVDIEEADVLAPTSEFELPQVVKSSTHVALDKPVSGCAAPAQ
ncbi:tyrosinase precursor [Akanthomyces lecanii RCEF 1005]|uniref:Tyrosinase n=1 Tax=Akanthomyces lecanii RCEF 1005 TaxID=1081108 RepID=A0A168F2E9_CORDF|nr:tyrosinase precursor [Akanthomyces lecanii RCEF 1005]